MKVTVLCHRYNHQKRRSQNKNTGTDFINDHLETKIKLYVVYQERTEPIWNSSESTCFKI